MLRVRDFLSSAAALGVCVASNNGFAQAEKTTGVTELYLAVCLGVRFRTALGSKSKVSLRLVGLRMTHQVQATPPKMGILITLWSEPMMRGFSSMGYS